MSDEQSCYLCEIEDSLSAELSESKAAIEELKELLIEVQIVRKRSASYGVWRKIDAVVGRHREAEYKNSRTPSP